MKPPSSQSARAGERGRRSPKKRQHESDVHFQARLHLWLVETLEPYTKRTQARILNFVSDHFSEEEELRGRKEEER